MEPEVKRTIAFLDGQNLYHAARKAFGYSYPNYDVRALAAAVCRSMGWSLTQICFYTGVPSHTDDPSWHSFWTDKLAVMRRQGVHVIKRPVYYHRKRVTLLDGRRTYARVGQEKGVDVRVALDVIGMALQNEYDVALVFSQDQDLSELAEDLRLIAVEQRRWIKLACAYPVGPGTRFPRGIANTDWIPIDRATYAACLDPRDYSPSLPPPPWAHRLRRPSTP